ncbi:hypothetical protein DFJ58DRAFT_729620 [Suillus subalutaceus]|uniref:uncharacterized protein n=1 Tax=Suillus subalutaceus TaxID=48586 RepID=UPI001B87CB16|nr:uncharacterized protein DFJ58DRAFT_729620 [Suillus subalutaceus]KAG1849131.1 hypothetical protein DFJ58DRAFT_729620 [Suillus subalutaceus]
MSYLYWQDSELYNHVKASQAGQSQATADDGQSTQQDYLPSALVNSYKDPTPADTQHQVMYGMNSTSNDQVLAPVGLHDAGLSESDDSGPLPSDVSVPLPLLDQQIGQPNILRYESLIIPIIRNINSFNSAVGQPSNDGFPTQIPCLWTDHQGKCDFSVNTIKSMLTHISSQHLRKKQPSASQVQCHICSPPKTIRRDTIRRHIREIHYGDKCRRRHS